MRRNTFSDNIQVHPRRIAMFFISSTVNGLRRLAYTHVEYCVSRFRDWFRDWLLLLTPRPHSDFAVERLSSTALFDCCLFRI